MFKKPAGFSQPQQVAVLIALHKATSVAIIA